MPAFAVWILTALLMLAALLGTVVPGLPDAPLILAAAGLHKALLPGYLSGWTLAAFAFLSVLSLSLDGLCTFLGARRGGASRWGITGGVVGAVLGLAGGPFGVPIGAALGAALAELALAGRPPEEAFRAGLGAALGFLASTAGRFLICLTMIAAFLLDCFFFR